MSPLSISNLILRVQDFEGVKKNLTLQFLLKDRLEVLPYKGNSPFRGVIIKGSTFESKKTLKITLKSFSLYPF